MRPAFVFLGLILVSSVAFGGEPTFKEIHCVDADRSTKAPVYIDIVGHPDAPARPMGFEMGNSVEIMPGQYGKSATAMGMVTSMELQGNRLLITGSFGTALDVDARTGEGIAQGPLKYDARTGEPTYYRVKNYPVRCVNQ